MFQTDLIFYLRREKRNWPLKSQNQQDNKKIQIPSANTNTETQKTLQNAKPEIQKYHRIQQQERATDFFFFFWKIRKVTGKV